MRRFCLVVCVLMWLPAAPSLAAPTIELELSMQRGFPRANSGQWLKMLSGLKFSNLRMRIEQPGDEASIQKSGGETSPRYKVIGILTADNRLLLPGGQFSMHDRTGIAKWMEAIGEGGSEEVSGGKSAFGLSKTQLSRINNDLGKEVRRSTKGSDAQTTIERIGRSLIYTIEISPEAARALREDGKVRDELKGMSSGSALAAILRPAGLCIRPVRVRGELKYKIDAAKQDSKMWPIGWVPKQKPRKLVPKLYEWLPVELDNVPLTESLSAIEKRLKIPFLLDHNALAINDIELEKVLINFPEKRTYYGHVLSHALSKAKLKSELRVDEAGKPFFWITSIKQ